jgi:hypothetical protein
MREQWVKVNKWAKPEIGKWLQIHKCAESISTVLGKTKHFGAKRSRIVIPIGWSKVIIYGDYAMNRGLGLIIYLHTNLGGTLITTVSRLDTWGKIGD